MREIWINKKNNKEYILLNKNVVNATYKDNGKVMYLYTNRDMSETFVREKDEFTEKFDKKER